MTADALLEDAFAHHRAGRLEQAEALYRNVLLQEPDSLNALQLLGAIASDTSRHQEAVVWLDRAASVLQARGNAAAQHAVLYYNLGNALAAAGRSVEAVASYRLGLTLDPAMSALWAHLAAALTQTDDLAGAATAYEAALRLSPARADWLLMLGTIDAGLGRHEAAADVFCRVLVLDPGNTEAQRALGLALLSLDRPVEASEPLSQSATHHAPMSRWDAAATCFTQAMALHPGDAETHWMLGRVA
jgi:tetratricopeptide (TPR) repeat protein